MRTLHPCMHTHAGSMRISINGGPQCSSTGSGVLTHDGPMGGGLRGGSSVAGSIIHEHSGGSG